MKLKIFAIIMFMNVFLCDDLDELTDQNNEAEKIMD